MGLILEPTTFGFPDLPKQEAGALLIRSKPDADLATNTS